MYAIPWGTSIILFNYSSLKRACLGDIVGQRNAQYYKPIDSFIIIHYCSVDILINGDTRLSP